MTYTANGNITTLTRKHNNRGLSGITVTSTPETLDGLSYTYASGFGNKLTKVEDSGLTAGFNNAVTANAEYKYDTIGNLIKDRNKGIDSIKYNDLGKVSRIKFSTGAFIVYSYDAAGTKLKVKNYNTSGTLVTTTDYVGGFVYTNNALSFFGSPEGRVVKNGSNLEYQYAISDHQGNTRVVFSSATASAIVKTATFEGSGGDNSGEFSNVTGVVSFTAANHTPSGIKVVRMNQSTPVGPSKSLKVFPGDKVDMEVYSYYESASGYGTTNNSVGAMVTAIAGAFGGVSGAGGESGSIFNSINSALGGFGIGSNPGDAQPAAFLNYILVDQNYKVVDAGWTGVPSSANFAKQLISIPQLTIKEAGYIFVYLSYEDLSNNYVYFDDFKVSHTPSNLLQANEYYPFGMQNENSWTRENAMPNNFMYNQSSELNQTTGWYDLPYRAFDPILGRFNGVDALASTYESTSPYSYGSNNPIYFSDPTGLGSVAGIELINNELIIDFNHIGTYGGHWSNDGSNGGAGSYNDFNSADAAFWAGYAYNEYHESWGSIPGMAASPAEARSRFEYIKAYRSIMQNLVAASGGWIDPSLMQLEDWQVVNKKFGVDFVLFGTKISNGTTGYPDDQLLRDKILETLEGNKDSMLKDREKNEYFLRQIYFELSYISGSTISTYTESFIKDSRELTSDRIWGNPGNMGPAGKGDPIQVPGNNGTFYLLIYFQKYPGNH